MKYTEYAITVTEVNQYVKNKIAEDEYLNNVLVKGEISNFKNHYTRTHVFYTKRRKLFNKMRHVQILC